MPSKEKVWPKDDFRNGFLSPDFGDFNISGEVNFENSDKQGVSWIFGG